MLNVPYDILFQLKVRSIMERATVAVVTGLILIAALSAPVLAGNCYPPPMPCAPRCAPPTTLITKMVPCTKTEIVSEVVPYTRCVPVKKIGYRCQKVMLKGFPVGLPCGQDPCTKCCPQPFCQVVDQKVPYVYYETQKVRSYTIRYRPVCRPVMLPQTYMVQAYPMCQ
jgi:hypothetical protein